MHPLLIGPLFTAFIGILLFFLYPYVYDWDRNTPGYFEIFNLIAHFIVTGICILFFCFMAWELSSIKNEISREISEGRNIDTKPLIMHV